MVDLLSPPILLPALGDVAAVCSLVGDDALRLMRAAGPASVTAATGTIKAGTPDGDPGRCLPIVIVGMFPFTVRLAPLRSLHSGEKTPGE